MPPLECSFLVFLTDVFEVCFECGGISFSSAFFREKAHGLRHVAGTLASFTSLQL